MNFNEKIWPLKDRLFRLALRLLDNRSEAEDVVQEVMVKLWKNAEKNHLIENIEAWSYRLTKNQALDKLKGGYRKRKTGLEFQLNTPAKTLAPDKQMESTDTMEYIKSHMQALPEDHRMVMHLRDIEELSYKEICDALEMSMTQVKSNLFRARQAMRKVLTKSNDHE